MTAVITETIAISVVEYGREVKSLEMYPITSPNTADQKMIVKFAEIKRITSTSHFNKILA